MSKYDGVIAEIQAEDAQQRARAAGVSGPEVDPDAMGRAMRLADQRGLPPGVVADNLPEYDKQQQLDGLSDAASASPALARWLGDPNQTALAKDDSGVLSSIGRRFNSGLLAGREVAPWLPLPQSALDLEKERKAAAARGPQMMASPDPSWFTETMGLLQSGWYGGKAAVGFIPLPNLGDARSQSLQEQVARGFGASSSEDYGISQSAAYIAGQQRTASGYDVISSGTQAGFDEIAAAEKTKDTGKIALAVATNPRVVMAVVAQSLGTTAPQLALSAVIPASRIVAGVTVGTGSFATEQGMTILDVMGDAGVETSDPAAVSAFLRNKPAMEKARQKALARGVAVGTFDALTAGFAGRLIANSRRTAVSIAGRVAGEAAVQAGGGAAGEATAQLASEGKITSQSDIFLEAAAEMPTFLAEGRGQIAEARRAAMHNADRFDAHQEQRAISDLVNLASQSKTRERSATRFESLIRDMTSEGEDTIYLSADGAQRLFQSANSEGGPDLGGLVDSDALREAIATGGEVAIPLEKYATLVSPEMHAQVADQVRLQPGGRHDLPPVSPEEIQDAITAGLAEAQQQESRENGPAGQVYDDVVGQLLTRQDEKLARQNASVVQSVYRNLAERVGTDAWSLYQQFKINIPGAATDTRGRARGVDIDVDPFLDALRSGKMPTDREIYGNTLVSALHAAGGLRDSGGELANMDAAKARPGLVNNLAGMSLDDALVWAYQEGFITQAPTNQQEGAYDVDAPDINTLLDMLAQDLGGNPVYRPAVMNAERAAFRDNAMGLQDELDQRGIDLQQADNATARQALGYGPSPVASPAADERADGKTLTTSAALSLVHGSNRGDLSIDSVQIVREGQKQAKKGRKYGGFYLASVSDFAHAEGYAEMLDGTPTVYEVVIAPGTKVLMKTGDITRLSESYIGELTSEGYGLVVGKDMRGRTEYVVIDPSVISSISDGGVTRENVAESGTAKTIDDAVAARQALGYGQKAPNEDGSANEKTREEVEDDLRAERDALNEENDGKVVNSPLSRAIDAIVGASLDEQGLIDAVRYGIENGRSEIARFAAEKLRRSANRTKDAKPGVSEDSSKYEGIAAALSARADEAERLAAEAEALLGTMPPEAPTRGRRLEQGQPVESDGVDYAVRDLVAGPSGRPESAATRALVDQAVADGDLAKMLQGIATQEGIDADQAALALRLAEITPELNVTMVAAPANANAAGIYNNTTNEIWIHQAVPSVVLHEVLHGVTSAMMTSPTLRRSNATVARAVAEFNDLLGAAQAHFAGMETDGADVPAALRATLQDPRGPLSNIKELLTYGMTDKRFQEWLATVPAPAGREESRTAWQWFKDAIATMLGVTGQERTALDALIESTSDLVDFAQANPRAANFAQMSEANRLGVPITDAAALNQGGEKPRGAVTFEGVPGARVFNIELLKGMDASTFMHEMGHVYLEVLNDLAAREDAPAQIVTDMATLNTWLGREAGAAFTVDQHEQFARGWEAYLREGKAPSSALRRTFAAFKVWLTALYRSVRSLNVELTDDVRNVMDRIVASDAEIEEARSAQYQGALITDAMAVGMSFEQFQAYNDAVRTAQADAEATVVAEVLLAERREQQAWYNREKREVRAQVLEEVRNMPVYRAQRLLRNGKLPDGELAPDELRVKLSKDELLDKYGQSFLRNLVGMYSVEGGVRADEAASLYGFGSGREMVDALVNAPRLNDAVAAETDARMKDRHPDPMTDGTLPDRAMVAAHRDRQADVMVREIRALEQHVNGRQVSQAAVVKGVARQIIQGKKLRNLQPATYRSAEARAGREAFEAAAKQDWPVALAARRRQLLNFELFREAVRARDESARSAKYLAKFSETKTRARLGKAGSDYLDQVDGLLDRFDFRKISDKAADRRSSLATWIEVQAQKGIDVNLPSKIMDEAFTMPYREMTVADLAALRDAVRSIDHLARLKGKLLLAGEVRDAAEVDAAMAASLAESHAVRQVTTGDRTNSDKIREAFMQGRVIQATATDMARELDGFKDQGAIWMNTVGVMRDAVNNRLNPALQQAQDDLAKVYVKHYTKAEIRAFSDRVPMPEVNGDLWSKSRLLGLALNWGNVGNREAILTQARARMSQSQVNSLLSRLDSRDWAFVEDVWRLIDAQWPAIAAAQKKRTGLVPERVQADPFVVQTSDGKTLQIPGGYYPLKYESDSVRSMKDLSDDFYNSIRTGRTAKAATKNGHTIERVGSGGRTVRLDTGVVPQHLRDVLRDVHLGDAVNYVHNVLNGQEFKEAVDSTGTQEYRQALEVWLKDAASGEIGPRVGHERWMRAARQNFTASVLTFKVTSALLQLSGVIPTIVTIGQKNAMAGISQFLGKPRSMRRYVQRSSPYMDSRLRTHIEAVQTVMDAEAGRFASGKAASIRFGYWMIGQVQGLVDTVTWLGAEQAGMEKFGNDIDRARAYADDVVTRAQGSGEFIDKSPLQRGTLGDNVRQTEWIKATTALQGYMIAKGNLAYEQTRKANLRNPRQAMKWAADMVMLFSIEGLLTAALTAKLPKDDEDDGLLDDLGEWAIKDALATFFGVIPGGGVLVDQFRGYDSSGVVAGAWKSYADLLERVTPGEDGEVDMDKGVVKAAVTAGGVTLGIPSTQINKTIDAIEARADGRDVSPYEYLTGPKKESK